MKKSFLTAIFLIGIAQLASATPIMCDVVMQPNSSNIVLSSNCTVNPDPGFFISSLTLTGFDSFTGGVALPIVDFTGAISQSSSVFSIPSFCQVTSDAGNNSIDCPLTVQPSSTFTGLDLSTYTVSVSSASNTEVQGSVAAASITLALNYGETQIPSTVPEPYTLGLMTGGLLGLGILARRKKARLT
jgi:PEP-CTERM motif-containing protein